MVRLLAYTRMESSAARSAYITSHQRKLWHELTEHVCERHVTSLNQACLQGVHVTVLLAFCV